MPKNIDSPVLAIPQLPELATESIKGIVDELPWMNECTFTLLHRRSDIEKYIDKCIELGLAAFDIETTGLNTREHPEKISSSPLVGVALATSRYDGAYIPIAHEDSEYNVNLEFIVSEIKRLSANCRLIFHNFKFDGQVLKNYGIDVGGAQCDPMSFEDTILMATIYDSSRKAKGLKVLSKEFLGREMLNIKGLGIAVNDKTVPAFDQVPPEKALYYAASDTVCTYYLYERFTELINQQDPKGNAGPWGVYNKIEKPCLFVTMEMERNYVLINKDYLIEIRDTLKERCKKCVSIMHNAAGRPFDVNSAKQLGVILFEELKLPYTGKKIAETKSKTYETSVEVLERIKDKHPIVSAILDLRGYEKQLTTYVENFIKNADENNMVKFELNQFKADTGRFTATGGKGLVIDGYCGVNCQNLPRPKKNDPKSFNIRKALVARPGFKIVTIDYSGEELRIAANLSGEKKWINEFIHGTGDLHTITGQVITGKSLISKEERGIGKTLNFLTLYGGGAAGFAAQAKITFERAKKMIQNFFKQYTGISAWIKREVAKGRKIGYSTTAMGRRRPLAYFYKSGDKFMASKGDRCVINSAVQGCLQPHERCLTNKGYLPIYEIAVRKENGEDLKVWTGSSWENFNVVNRGECQFAYIELENGLKLDCDTRHEVLTVGESGYVFTKYRDLDENSLICSPIPRALEFGEYPSQTFFSGGKANNSKDILIQDASDFEFIAFVLGIATGDGNIIIGSRNSVTISFGEKKLSEYYGKLEQGFKKLGLTLNAPRKMRGSKGDSYQATVNSKALVALFTYFGFNKATAKTKRVPHRIYTCPISMRRAYLKGCFLSDGSRSLENRYVLHTANKELLRDIQLVGLHLGLASYVKTNGDGSHSLLWSNLSRVEQTLNLPKVNRGRRTGGKMLLPRFLHKKVYALLQEDGRYVQDSRDRVLVCNLNKGQNILVQTAVELLEKYDCDIPEMYYHYPLKEKKNLPEVSDTYTLSVFSPLHRFDSAGIISKNTGADIIKIALRRVSNYIRENGLSDKIRVLMPIHDEIVYEIANDGTPEGEAAFGKYIEDLSEIMKIDDIITALKWPVHLEVDAEYGDSLSITNDYFKEKEAALKEHQQEESSEPEKEEKAPEADDSGDNFTKLPDPPLEEESEEGSAEQVSSLIKSTLRKEVSKINQDTREKEFKKSSADVQMHSEEHLSENGLSINFNASVQERIEKLAQDPEEPVEEPPGDTSKKTKLEDFIDKRGFFEWPVTNISDVTLSQIVATLRTLKKLDSLLVGPKYRIKLVSKSGEVLYKSQQKVSVDAFTFAAVWLNI